MKVRSKKILLNLALLFMIFQLSISKSVEEKFYEVTMNVFSGTPNPNWTINGNQFQILKKLIIENKFYLKSSNKVLGFSGFGIKNSSRNSNKMKIVGKEAELFLLTTNKDLPISLISYVRIEIENRYTESKESAVCNKVAENCGRFSDNENEFGPCCEDSFCECNPEILECRCKSNDEYFKNYANCNSIIKGPDTPVEFNPNTDCEGCFKTRVYDNNCYNYSTDILTNTFAQPGRGTQHKWVYNTCDDVRRAATSDGLVWVGTDVPKDQPSVGHYVALLIWPNTNFHWVRLDKNGYWSHKPGGTPVKNTDNYGKAITDPSIQDFSPWSQYCGIFQVKPSILNIN